MYLLHYSLQSRSIWEKQYFNVLLKHFVMRIQMNLLIHNIFISYKLSFKKDLLSSLLRAYIVLSFVYDLIWLKIWLRVLYKKIMMTLAV